MTTLREAAQQALEAERDDVLRQLDDCTNQTWAGKRARWARLVRAQADEIDRLRAALEQEGQEQEQEPVAWQGVHDNTDLYYHRPPQADVRPLYTHPAAKDCGEAGHDEGRCGNASCMAHPPRREWKGLSENELGELMRDSCGYPMCPNGDDLAFAHAIEQALKERNHG